MAQGMTIVRQLNVLFIVAAIALCCALALMAAHRDYNVAATELQQRAAAAVVGRPDLQYSIYTTNAKALAKVLEDFQLLEGVTAAIVFNTDNALASSGGAGDLQSVYLNTLRRDLSPTDAGLTSLDESGTRSNPGFWQSLIGNQSPLYISLPVLTATNPSRKGLTPEDFSRALLTRHGNASRVVIGYVALAVDRSVLLERAASGAGRVFLVTAALLGVFLLLMQVLLKRATRSISRLRQLALALASGEAVDATEIENSGEFVDIARALNSAVKEARNRNQEMSMEKNLFRLQAEQSASALSAKDAEINRITEEVTQSREQIRKLASYDRITELPNRGLFLEHVNRLLRLAERDGTRTALVCMSLVNFDRIKESMGRNIGDVMLREVAKRLVGSLQDNELPGHSLDTRQNINISRLSGDEFAVVLSGLASNDQAGDVAQRVAAAVAGAVKVEGRELFPNPALGIAVAPGDGNDAERLLKYASAAQHHAAMSSTTSHLFFTEHMDTGDGDEFKLAPAIRRAMAANEFSIHYQPQINTTYGSVTSAEALLRWEHPEYGQVSPFKFVPVAEESGLIIELGNWVLVEACRQLRAFRDEGLDLPRVAINVSPQQLSQDFPGQVHDALRRFGLDGSSLELGLSEDILARDDGRALYILMELKGMGVHLSLENFGTTPSSFVYISRYPLDDIKIDRSFVAECDQREEATKLVDSVIAMTNSLGLVAVAEGVETEGEYRYLANRGVRLMRGYLFSRPIPADELREQVGAPWHFMKRIQTI